MSTEEQQQQLIQALQGAAIGIAAATENHEITPTQIESLLTVIINQLKTIQH